jgi:hypothetical protein
MEYAKVNPRARELLVTLVRTFLDDVAEVK